MKARYFTIVIRADTDFQAVAARQFVPGIRLGACEITGVALGDALTLNDKLKGLIAADKENEVSALEHADIAAHLSAPIKP